MEKPAKPNTNIILNFLRGVTSAVSFQNPPFSPNRNDTTTSKPKPHYRRGFSGPIISMIPIEARRRFKSDKGSGNDFDSQQEPTSPKVSCVGQINRKHKKKIKKIKPKSDVPTANTKKSFTIKKMFSSKKLGRTKSAVLVPNKLPMSERAPSLSQMKRFASGRDAFANFDWAVQRDRVASDDRRRYYSDEDRGDSEDEVNEEVIIPFSAPMAVGGGVCLQPRKEVNLWKRRTMTPPCRLQLDNT